MASRYRSDDGSTIPVQTIFKHSKADIERGHLTFIKQRAQKTIADNLKGFGFSNRGGVEALSRAECKHVTEEIIKKGKVDSARYAEVDRLISQLIGGKNQ
jgi:hypothetical protein